MYCLSYTVATNLKSGYLFYASDGQENKRRKYASILDKENDGGELENDASPLMYPDIKPLNTGFNVLYVFIIDLLL
jgi:hypothetical protein